MRSMDLWLTSESEPEEAEMVCDGHGDTGPCGSTWTTVLAGYDLTDVECPNCTNQDVSVARGGGDD